MTPHGHLALLLHAHLPFVRHPEHLRHLEEHWLFEALTDCYLPLLGLLREAAARGSAFRLTLSLSPTLLSMLADEFLAARYLDYLDRLDRLCKAAAARPPRSTGRFLDSTDDASTACAPFTSKRSRVIRSPRSQRSRTAAQSS